MSKPGNSTVTNNSQPPAQVLQNYSNITSQANNVAGTTYQPYSGSTIAGFNPEQQAGFANVNSAAGAAQPYIGQAANLVAASTSGIDPTATLSQYENPYTQQVTQATQNLFNQQNAQQSTQLTGNAVAQGAYGGDRAAVAQGVLAGQQQAQEAPVLANIQSQGYNQALQTGLQTQEANAWLNSQGAFALGNLGQEAQSTALTGAQAQLGIGGQQQQLAQNELNIPYQNYQNAQAYPFQTTGWQAGIDEGTGSLSGGSSSTTQPGPSAVSQVAGLGLAGAGAYNLLGGAAGIAGLFARDGGAINDYAVGGAVPDVPDMSISFVPSSGSPGAHSTIPSVPHAAQVADPLQQGMSALSLARGISGMGGGSQAPTPSAEAAAFSAPSDGGWMDAAPAYDDGGAVSPTLAAGMGSGNPMVSGLLQRYSSLPTEQLREMAVRYPPNTQQGQMVQTMLRRRQMMPQSDAAQTQPTAGFAMGGMPRFDDGGATSYSNPGPSDWRYYTQPDPTTDPHNWQYYTQDHPADSTPVPVPTVGKDWHSYIQPAAVNLDQPPDDNPTLAPDTGAHAWDNVPPEPAPVAGMAPPQPRATGRAMSSAEELPVPPIPPDQPPAADPSPAPQRAGMGTDQPAHKGDFYSRLSGPGGALLMAGLGIMGGRSPYAAVNIGEGGMQGLNWAERQRQIQQQADFNNTYKQGMLHVQQQKADTGDQRAQTYATLSAAHASELQAQAMHLMAAATVAGATKDPPAVATAKWLMDQNPGLNRMDALNIANGAATKLQIASQNNDTRQAIAARADDLKRQGLDEKTANDQAAREIAQRGQDTTLLGNNPQAAPLPRVPVGQAAPQRMAPPPAAVDYVKQHPEAAPDFISKYGANAYSSVFAGP